MAAVVVSKTTTLIKETITEFHTCHFFFFELIVIVVVTLYVIIDFFFLFHIEFMIHIPEIMQWKMFPNLMYLDFHWMYWQLLDNIQPYVSVPLVYYRNVLMFYNNYPEMIDYVFDANHYVANLRNYRHHNNRTIYMDGFKNLKIEFNSSK